MQALILAAGRGSRLGKKSEDVPKCLLEVGRRPIVEHQLETLADAGVGPVGMVLGYCADEIKEVVGIRAEYILNPRWKTTNSLYSFWLARDWIRGPVLVLNSDLLFDPQIIERLLKVKGDAIAYDSSSGDGGEQMKVRVEDGHLADMSKTLPAEEISGENVGILCLTEETARQLIGEAGRIVESGEEKLWLGSAVSAFAKQRQIKVVDVAGLPWGEIDFSYDLDRVRKEVWPEIRRRTWRRKKIKRYAPWAAAAIALLVLYLGVRHWTAPESAWATASIEDAPSLKISAGDRAQHWSLLAEGDDAVIPIHGEGRVRVESRLLMSSPDPMPYVLEVRIDGNRIDWYKETAVPSNSWRHPDWTVGKRRQTSLDIGPGPHEVQVRLVASDGAECLLRVRHEDTEIGE